MEPISEQERDGYLMTYRDEALHLEMRDVYATSVETDRFARWQTDPTFDPDEPPSWWPWWRDSIGAGITAGKSLRRLRIVSEPVSAYIRFEHAEARWLVQAGEQVRWLPRDRASVLLLPGNDCWVFDRQTVAFTHFSGAGQVLGHSRTTEPAIVDQVVTAFESAWTLGIDHPQYRPD